VGGGLNRLGSAITEIVPLSVEDRVTRPADAEQAAADFGLNADRTAIRSAMGTHPLFIVAEHSLL
jgi:hypothetical protein